MTARILTYQGSQDGIRFGTIILGGTPRSYFWDRLNETLRLFTHDASSNRPSREDKTSWRVSLALCLLKAMEPGEDAWLEHCVDEDGCGDLSTGKSNPVLKCPQEPIVTVPARANTPIFRA